MPHFDRIDYLKSGTARQQSAYRVLSKHGLMEKLRDFDPILTGTIPINIDIQSSDLDVICCCTDAELFKETLIRCFGTYEGFTIAELPEFKAIVANFRTDEFEIEVFGQAIPTRQQRAYRHMLVEHALLELHGEDFRQQVIRLKQQGMKTEPAFAQLLGLEGDPYEALLAFEK